MGRLGRFLKMAFIGIIAVFIGALVLGVVIWILWGIGEGIYHTVQFLGWKTLLIPLTIILVLSVFATIGAWLEGDTEDYPWNLFADWIQEKWHDATTNKNTETSDSEITTMDWS